MSDFTNGHYWQGNKAKQKNIKTNNNPFWALWVRYLWRTNWKFFSFRFHVTRETCFFTNCLKKKLKHEKIVRLLNLYVNLSAIFCSNVRLYCLCIWETKETKRSNEDAFHWYRSRQEFAYLPSNWWPFHDKEEKIRPLQLHNNSTKSLTSCQVDSLE